MKAATTFGKTDGDAIEPETSQSLRVQDCYVAGERRVSIQQHCHRAAGVRRVERNEIVIDPLLLPWLISRLQEAQSFHAALLADDACCRAARLSDNDNGGQDG